MIKADRQERLLRPENILRLRSIQTLVVSMLIKWPGASLRNVRRAQVFTSTMTVPQDRNVWGDPPGLRGSCPDRRRLKNA